MLRRLFLFCITLLPLGVFGFDIPAYQGYVTDYSNTLSSTEISQLSDQIKTLEQATSIEVAVLLVDTIDDDPNLLAADIGEKWGVGKSDADNGIMILIVVNDRKRSIQVGYGLEGVLPDIIIKSIGETQIPYHFKKQDYVGGLSAVLYDIQSYIEQDPEVMDYYNNQGSTDYNEDGMKKIGWMLFMLFFMGASLGKTIKTKKDKKKKVQKKTLWGNVLFVLVFIAIVFVVTQLIIAVVGGIGVWLFGLLMGMAKGEGRGGIFFGPGMGGSSFGGGFSGGSFGGFGGGSFGGGGAGGSW